MSAFELSWYLKIDKHRNCGVIPSATLKDSLHQIKTALDHAGVVSISLADCPDKAPQRLQLSTGNGNSVITLGDGALQNQRVRGYSWDNPAETAANNGMNNIVAIKDKQLVCNEATKVFQIFEEFFETGKVSEERLN